MPDLAVYIHERGKKPKKTDLRVPTDKKLPNELEVDGRKYQFIGADLSRKTITYTDVVGSER